MIQLDDRYYVKYQDPGNFTLMYEKRPEDLTDAVICLRQYRLNLIESSENLARFPSSLFKSINYKGPEY